MGFELNYDDAIHLDAEELAEQGIAEAYCRLLPRLRQFVRQPSEIIEEDDADLPSYAVRCGDKRFLIYAPETEETSNSRGNATVALFTIINEQLAGSTHRLYALNGGNDLHAIFLTPAQAAEAQKSISVKQGWPYLPKDEPEWYGQYH